MLVDARSQIDALKSDPIVPDEPECIDCSIFLGDDCAQGKVCLQG
jgi:hypothetical protein